MKINSFVYVLLICLISFSSYAQSTTIQKKDCSIVIGNTTIFLGIKIDKINQLNDSFVYQEIFHKDYGPLTWKSSELFIPDSNYDILSYTNDDIEIQAYRGNRKVNIIKFKTNKYHINDYWVGKRIDTESLINKHYTKYINTYIIPIFDNSMEIGVFQIDLLDNRINEIVLTNRLE